MRDKIGSFASAQNESFPEPLDLAQYVLLDDNATQEQKAQFPLREASIQVSEIPASRVFIGPWRSCAHISSSTNCPFPAARRRSAETGQFINEVREYPGGPPGVAVKTTSFGESMSYEGHLFKIRQSGDQRRVCR